ncbi:LysR substrate-binding domain-containing protein [Acidovorax sp. GBBC 3334]|uniref:LysR family transcriptional regulator n=1 Tax=unclassified Acidovorax TaxID=2684926 RepID=UPI00230414B8|nr:MULTISPECIES: LysR family transcriptional regulator [unclassified Acidovorax]MDA8456751.1 LysR substrate-binding domain-containing protein [Acidovorax sp. GBBC 3334]MDA8523023.1 LysR substrate-binding domain-containing protein [Acidovorax sp. NCPPB 4044]
MDMTRLRALRELARCGTMAAAAEALALTPSAVSQQIAQLEAEAGLALTERQGRGVRLTPGGEALVRHAERLMAVLDEAKSELALLRREIAGELRVAAFPSIASALLPGTIQALRAAYPRLRLAVEEMEPDDGLVALGAWRADIALIDHLALRMDRRQGGFGFVPLAQDSLHVLLPDTHPLAGRPWLGVADLRHESWAMDAASSSFGEFVRQRCLEAGFEPRMDVRASGFEVVSAMVAAGCAVTVVPGLRLLRPLAGTRAVPLRPDGGREISVAYRRGERAHPAVTVFIDEIVRAAARLCPRPAREA